MLPHWLPLVQARGASRPTLPVTPRCSIPRSTPAQPDRFRACTFVFVVPSFAFPYLDPYYYTSKKVLVFPCFTDIAPSSHFATLPITPGPSRLSLRPFHAFVDSLCSLGFPAYTGLPSVCISQRNLSTPAIKTPVVRVLRKTLMRDLSFHFRQGRLGFIYLFPSLSDLPVPYKPTCERDV